MSSNVDASIPTELYSLVLQFLKDAGLSQTAKIFKKEINKSIKVVNQKYGLVEVFKSYNSLVAGKNTENVESDNSSSNSGNSSNNEENEGNDESSSSSSEDEVDRVNESSNEKLKNDNEIEDSSSSSSGDDSDSSDSSSIKKENNRNALSLVKELASSDSSSSDSSSEQGENEEQSVEASNVSEVSNESSSESSSSSSSSEDEENGKMEIRSDNELVSSSSEESDKEQEQGKGSNVEVSNKTDSNNNNDNESEESDSESGYESKSGNTQNNISNIKERNGENRDKLFHSNGKITEKNPSYKINGPLTNENKLKHKLDSNNDTLDGKDYARPSKKLNSNVSVHFKPLSVYKNQRKNGKSNKAENKSNGNGNIYNRRINPEKVEFLDERLKDNSFLAKDGAVDSYGYKAHNDLFATRGKDFRAQKTKKKRGSYRGGKIDFESHSIKFAADN